jgi:hypothetical protein
MAGLARRLAKGPVKSKKELTAKYKDLLKQKDYRDAVETGTSQEANVATRIRLATAAFASLR